MNEFDLIYDLIAPAAGHRDDVLLGIGDDGALLRQPPGEALAVVADTLVAGRHFPLDMAAEDIGWRAAAVNLSDLAAMGATPRWATLALTFPEADEAWLRSFVRGLMTCFERAGVALVGGDTTRGPLTITVQAMGSVPLEQSLTRRGAQPGDLVFVSGTLGDAAGGLAQWHASETHRSLELRERFTRPQPRVALGQALRGLASACIDVSDGLLADLGHIAEGSRVGMRITAVRLPLSTALRESFDAPVALRCAATGGDDYELAFTAPAGEAERILGLDDESCPVTCIGEVVAGEAVVLCAADGATIDLGPGGFQHF